MKTQKVRRHRRPSVLAAVILAGCLACTAAAQSWPDKIDGYKVYDAKIAVTNASLARSASSDALVTLTDPVLASVGLSGAAIDIGATVTSTKQSGSVDLITFRDIFVNGFKVDVVDYAYPFAFTKGEAVVLPKPARINLKITSLPQAAYRELVDGKQDISVTGTAFVFGRFKKMGFTFKRVVPVRIDLKVKNPLR